MGKLDGKAKVLGLMDEDFVWEDDATATTADMTEQDELTDIDSDGEEEQDDLEFAQENAPRPPPDKLMFNGDGESQETCHSDGWDVTTDTRLGRSNATSTQSTDSAGAMSTNEAFAAMQRSKVGTDTKVPAATLHMGTGARDTEATAATLPVCEVGTHSKVPAATLHTGIGARDILMPLLPRCQCAR